MKTAIVHPSIPAVPVQPANDDAQIAAEFDEVGRRGAAGDRKAIGAIALKLRVSLGLRAKGDPRAPQPCAPNARCKIPGRAPPKGTGAS
jgi:hypothetical protein